MFTYKTQVHVHDTDAAGRIFFANQFKIAHDAYEALLEKSGFSFPKMLKENRYFLPIVHAESDYKARLFAGDKITVSVTVGHIGKTSFAFDYAIHRGKTLVGTAKTVHVAINAQTDVKTPIPKKLRSMLESLIKR